MADTKTSALTELTARPAFDDLVPFVDISDTTMAASGTNKKIQFVNLGSDLLSPLTLGAEISVTGAVTATMSRMHVCSGTSANYTVALPAASGNAGKFIGLRMSTALTKIVTIDGNSSETIDGATTQLMHDGESVLLMCDGSNWFRLAGKFIPMRVSLTLSSVQSVVSDAIVPITFNSEVFDVGELGDVANNRIVIKRSGYYTVSLYSMVPGLDSGEVQYTEADKNGAQLIGMSAASSASSTDLRVSRADMFVLASGDLLTMVLYHNSSAGSENLPTGINAPRLTAVEVLP
jgi:hypothetical protein